MRFGPLPRMMTFDLLVRIRLVAAFVGAVHVRRERLELGRARVDALEGRHELFFDAALANRRLGNAVDGRDFGVAEPRPLQRPRKSADSSRNSCMPAIRRSSEICLNCSRNHGSM